MAQLNDKRQVAPLVVSVLFGVVASVAVLLRIVARRMKKAKLDASDYCIFAALVWITTTELNPVLMISSYSLGD